MVRTAGMRQYTSLRTPGLKGAKTDMEITPLTKGCTSSLGHSYWKVIHPISQQSWGYDPDILTRPRCLVISNKTVVKVLLSNC